MDSLYISDGTVTVYLSTAPNVVLEYTPRAAGVELQEAGRGETPDVVGFRHDNVTETLRTAVVGDTLANALLERDKLERLLRQAERVQAGSGEARVYVYGQRVVGEGATPLFRSELLAGRVQELDVDGYWPGRNVLRVSLAWTRRPWWEGARVELGVYGSGQYVVGGVTIKCAIGGSPVGNYVDLDPEPVNGDMPAPVEIWFTNSVTAYAVNRVYAALRSAPGVASFVHLLEAEALATGVTHASTECSGGYYQTLAWNSGAATKFASWGLTAAELAAAGGRWYRLLVRWAGAPNYADLTLQARVMLGGVQLWAGPWVHPLSTLELLELGSVLLPPINGPAAGNQALTLELWGLGASAVYSLNVDYIVFLGLDGFRRYDDLGTGLALNNVLVDDGAAGQVYRGTAVQDLPPTDLAGTWVVAGEPLFFRPGYQNRLCMFWSAGGVARADKAAKVQVFFRPRVVLP